MRSRFSSGASLLALLVVVPLCRAEEPEPYQYGLFDFTPTSIGSLPPFTASDLRINDPSAKAVESSVRLRFVERIFKVKSSYLERAETVNPFLGTQRRRNVFSLSASSDLLGRTLGIDSEFGFNSLDQGAAESLGRTWANMYRIALNGDWRGYKYGGEYRSLDKGFMHFKGGESGRSEDSLRIWSEKSFGPIRLKVTLSQLWENLNESEQTPRVTRNSALSLKHKTGDWQTSVSSAFSQRTDRFHGGTTADASSHEIRGVYQPFKALKITPLIKYASELNRSSGVRSRMPSASLDVLYASWRDVFKFAARVSYQWVRSSDRSTLYRNLNSGAKIIWNFDPQIPGLKTLSWEFSYASHRDGIARVNSQRSLGTKLTLTIRRF